jgi:hypothetical protein
MQVDRHDTSFSTWYSRHASKMLSFINVLCLQWAGQVYEVAKVVVVAVVGCRLPVRWLM